MTTKIFISKNSRNAFDLREIQQLEGCNNKEYTTIFFKDGSYVTLQEDYNDILKAWLTCLENA